MMDKMYQKNLKIKTGLDLPTRIPEYPLVGQGPDTIMGPNGSAEDNNIWSWPWQSKQC